MKQRKRFHLKDSVTMKICLVLVAAVICMIYIVSCGNTIAQSIGVVLCIGAAALVILIITWLVCELVLFSIFYIVWVIDLNETTKGFIKDWIDSHKEFAMEYIFDVVEDETTGEM